MRDELYQDIATDTGVDLAKITQLGEAIVEVEPSITNEDLDDRIRTAIAHGQSLGTM